MSDFWNTRTKNISPYIPGEQPKDRQFIKLNTNENPYPPSPKVIEAVKKQPMTACAFTQTRSVQNCVKLSLHVMV
jgi:histidinol-phosphate/aromatic aminotransferase/cobyric acid decarboxylase-like protein